MNALTVAISGRDNYQALLLKNWQLLLAAKESDALKVISTFAGGGGSSLGFSMAGFQEVAAVEFDDHAAKTFQANFSGVNLHQGDIRSLSAEQLMELAQIAPGELDVYDGSPPCQGFSTTGRRQFDDPRNQLFRDYVRLLRALQPRAFVMENVSGMVKGKMKLIFAEALAALKDCGYRVRCWAMNTKYFDVPQDRERVIFLGVRQDLNIEPSPLTPQSLPRTVGAALAGCEREEVEPLSERYAKYWKAVPVGRNLADVMVKITGRRAHFSDLVKLDPNKPSRTIVKMARTSGFATMVRWDEPRALTIPEAKRLASFPDEFILEGTYEQRWARIGNAVPPLFMKAIALHIKQNLLGIKSNNGMGINADETVAAVGTRERQSIRGGENLLRARA